MTTRDRREAASCNKFVEACDHWLVKSIFAGTLAALAMAEAAMWSGMLIVAG